MCEQAGRIFVFGVYPGWMSYTQKELTCMAKWICWKYWEIPRVRLRGVPRIHVLWRCASCITMMQIAQSCGINLVANCFEKWSSFCSHYWWRLIARWSEWMVLKIEFQECNKFSRLMLIIRGMWQKKSSLKFLFFIIPITHPSHTQWRSRALKWMCPFFITFRNIFAKWSTFVCWMRH